MYSIFWQTVIPYKHGEIIGFLYGSLNLVTRGIETREVAEARVATLNRESNGRVLYTYALDS